MLHEDGLGIARVLFEAGLFRTWYRDRAEGWVLVSGAWSPFYIQLRPVSSHPWVLRNLASAMTQVLRRDIPEATRLVGIAMAGIPLAVATSLESDLAAAFTRKDEPLSHGEHSSIEGELADGDRIVLVDDVVTGFTSKQRALDQIAESANLSSISVNCGHVLVVVDRAQGAREIARRAGIEIHSLLRLDTDGLEIIRAAMSEPEFEVIRDYIAEPGRFQDPSAQAKIKAMSRCSR